MLSAEVDQAVLDNLGVNERLARTVFLNNLTTYEKDEIWFQTPGYTILRTQGNLDYDAALPKPEKPVKVKAVADPNAPKKKWYMFWQFWKK